MRKTKIVCTMGPSTDKPGILRQLMENGMNVARFNFSHGDYEEHKGRFDKVRALSKELDLPIACMLDTRLIGGRPHSTYDFGFTHRNASVRFSTYLYTLSKPQRYYTTSPPWETRGKRLSSEKNRTKIAPFLPVNFYTISARSVQILPQPGYSPTYRPPAFFCARRVRFASMDCMFTFCGVYGIIKP